MVFPPPLRSGENAGLSRCPFPSLRSGRTRGTKPTALRRLSPALRQMKGGKDEIDQEALRDKRWTTLSEG
jgi:hypothetical protein